jgi:hypothetical protein
MHHTFYDAVRLLRTMSHGRQIMCLYAAQIWTDQYLREQETTTDDGSPFPPACTCDRCLAVRANPGQVVNLAR